MNTDPQARARRALQEYADAVPVPATTADSVTGGRLARTVQQRPRPWFAPVVVASAVLAVLAVATVLPYLRGGAVPSGEGGPPVRLPSDIAVRGWPAHFLTERVTESPPGPAIAIYLQGNGAGISGSEPKYVVVGADGSTYRRAIEAESGVAQPALAPDGSRIAVGSDAVGSGGKVTVVDLRTGDSRVYGVPLTMPRPLAWSPNARELVVGNEPYDVDGATLPRSGILLNLATGDTRSLGTVHRAAFSADGRLLAVQDDDQIRILRLNGKQQRTLPMPSGQQLAGPGAWSPDGRWLAIMLDWWSEDDPPSDTTPEAVGFIDALGRDNTAPPRSVKVTDDGARWDPDRLLGWRAKDRIVVYDADSAGRSRLVEVDLKTGRRTTLSRISGEVDDDEANIQWLQLATGLVAEAEVDSSASPDFGPWPVWLRALVAIAVLVPTGAVVGLVLALRRSRRRRTNRAQIPG